jgi:hypothetical protein
MIDLINSTNKIIFNNVKLFYNPPTVSETIHSHHLTEVYSYYINDLKEDKIYNLNNWAFLKPEEILRTNLDTNIFTKLPLVTITEKCFLIKYEVKNVGHTFFNVLHQIYYYYQNNLNYKVLIPSELVLISKFFKSFINLFFPNEDNIILINSNVIYDIEYLFFDKWCSSSYTAIFSSENQKYLSKINFINENSDIDCINFMNNELIYENNYLEKFLHSKLNENTFILKEKLYYKKICLIKNINNFENKNKVHINISYTINRSFSQSIIDIFKDQDYYILDPSSIDILELRYILNNCETLITSWGCISYINKILIHNENVKILLLSHIGYTHEFAFLPLYDIIPSCSKLKFIFNLKSEPDDLHKKIILKNLLELEK